MRRHRNRWAVVPVLALVSTALIATVPARAAEMPKAIRMSAGAMGQAPYMVTAVVSRWLQDAVPGLSASVIAGGVLANFTLVDGGKADIGVTNDSNYREAQEGLPPFKKKFTDLRFLANFQGYGVFYFMVAADTGLTSIRKDFVGRRYPLKIGTFLRAGTPELNARRVLGEYGVTYDDVRRWGGSVSFAQWSDLVNLLRDGHIQALVGNTSLPSHFHAEAAKARSMRMLPLDPDVIDAMIKKYGYLPVTIPKGTYGIVKEDMPSFGYSYIYFSHKRLPERIAYALVKQMAEHADEFRNVHATFKTFVPEKMPTGVVGPFHEGAERYYRERGWIKK